MTTTALVEQEAAPVATAGEFVSMFERLARDPGVPVDKLERLIELQERIMRHQAKAAFDAAFSDMQGELPIIDEQGAIVVNNVMRSKFGRHEDIQAAIKPILAKYGFSINHRNKRLENGKQLIIGVLRHRSGHSEEDEFECPPDASGGKNDIQALGSTREYGRRYTTISLLNIVTKGIDNDGQGQKKKPEQPQVPDGFTEWWDDLTATADNGTMALEKAWQAGNGSAKTKALMAYATKNRGQELNALKAKAARVAAQ
jgi:hypothetical protein